MKTTVKKTTTTKSIMIIDVVGSYQKDEGKSCFIGGQ